MKVGEVYKPHLGVKELLSRFESSQGMTGQCL